MHLVRCLYALVPYFLYGLATSFPGRGRPRLQKGTPSAPSAAPTRSSEPVHRLKTIACAPPAGPALTRGAVAQGTELQASGPFTPRARAFVTPPLWIQMGAALRSSVSD